MKHPLPLIIPLALVFVACGDPSASERGPIGAADSLGSCAAGDSCGGASDGNCFCDDLCTAIGDCCSDYEEICLGVEPQVTSIEVSGYVTGELVGNRANAEASWTQACEQWLTNMQNKFGAATETSCGEAENIASSSFLFVSRPTATLTASLPAGATVVESRAGRSAFGTLTGNLEPALRSWADACNAEIDRWQQIYGARLLAASCPEPVNIATSSRFFESEVELWLAPLEGDRVTASDYVTGELTGNLEPAVNSWNEACATMVAGSVELSAGDLEVASCEPRVDLASSSRLFASEVSVTFVGANPVASMPPPIVGESGNLDAALFSWRESCDSALAAIRSTEGDRLVGGVCGVPTNSASSGFRFESQPTIWHHQ